MVTGSDVEHCLLLEALSSVVFHGAELKQISDCAFGARVDSQMQWGLPIELCLHFQQPCDYQWVATRDDHLNLLKISFLASIVKRCVSVVLDSLDVGAGVKREPNKITGPLFRG
jgi:hypothetical protein